MSLLVFWCKDNRIPVWQYEKNAIILCNRSRNRFQNLQTFSMVDKIKKAKKPNRFELNSEICYIFAKKR